MCNAPVLIAVSCSYPTSQSAVSCNACLDRMQHQVGAAELHWNACLLCREMLTTGLVGHMNVTSCVKIGACMSEMLQLAA